MDRHVTRRATFSHARATPIPALQSRHAPPACRQHRNSRSSRPPAQPTTSWMRPNAACRYVSTAGLCTKCPSSAFSLLYVPVPAQQCCQAQPQRINLSRAAPACDPGYMEFGCTCIGFLASEPEAVTKCQEVSITLPTCGTHIPQGGCPEQACDAPASWDASQCCCAVRGKCK